MTTMNFDIQRTRVLQGKADDRGVFWVVDGRWIVAHLGPLWVSVHY